MSKAILTLTIFLAACTSSGDDMGDDDDDQRVCGNGLCEAGESSLSCPADCDSAPECSAADPSSCGGETICIAQQCVAAFGRNYVFTIVDATYPQRDGNGESWDVPGGLPDPFASLTINGVPYTSPTLDDTLTPRWNYALPPVVVPGGTVLRIDTFDEDVSIDDAGWACEANPFPARFLREGGFTCAGTGALATALVTVAVRPN